MLSLFEAAVKKHRAENRFTGVGKNRGAIGAARLEFALAEIDELSDLNLRGDLVERLFANQIGTHAR